MIRINELRLPLEHAPDALPAAVAQRLGLSVAAIRRLSVFKRSHDARKKNALMFIYSVDVDLEDGDEEARLLERFADDPKIGTTPDTSYHFVAQAPATLASRPVIVGFGPAGIFAALVLAQMGFRPIVLERGKAVRERTKDTWDLWRKRELHPDSNVQFGEGVKCLAVGVIRNFHYFTVTATFIFQISGGRYQLPFIVEEFFTGFDEALLIGTHQRIPGGTICISRIRHPCLFHYQHVFQRSFVCRFLQHIAFGVSVCLERKTS